MSELVEGRVDEDGSATLYARVTSRDGTGTSITGEGKALKQADLASITYFVSDLTADPVTEVASGTLTISSVIFNTLQTAADDPAYGGPSPGFNFRYDVPPSVFSEGGHVYRFEIKFTTSGGKVAFAKFDITADETRGS